MIATVILYRDRWKPGSLRILDQIFTCLGRSDNAAAAKHGNPTRLTTFPFGDLPTGDYMATRTVPGKPEKAYGRGIRWVLNPLSGDALTAKHNGRYGLLIHSGALMPDGRLRPTHGCLRVHDTTIEWLAANTPLAGFMVTVREEA